MTNMATVEIKAFVPAKDFELSKRFYRDMGFEMHWSSDEMAYFRAGVSSFLLQRFYVKEYADNFMMHMLVEDVESWWRHVEAAKLDSNYGVTVQPPEDRPWGIRDFIVVDPTGVLWRIGQDIKAAHEELTEHTAQNPQATPQQSDEEKADERLQAYHAKPETDLSLDQVEQQLLDKFYKEALKNPEPKDGR
jgi:catechol 2,3-dioxygenase-like lactoylglutathione lyase family enzyme